MPDATTSSDAPSSSAESFDAERHCFEREGCLIFDGVVAREPLAALTDEIRAAWTQEVSNGAMFAGGGNLSGHLNCFPGEASRFVYQALKARGIFEIARALSATPLGQPNVGCNLNLPGSSAQNEHVDGYAATPFLVVNVATVDTDLVNGAMEIIPESHRRTMKYWEAALLRQTRRRVPMKQGDALLRTSTLWHRGMPNRSALPRPMLAFTWEEGGSRLADPYSACDGRITFLPNRYKTDWKGRMMEKALVVAPRLGVAIRAARSLFD